MRPKLRPEGDGSDNVKSVLSDLKKSNLLAGTKATELAIDPDLECQLSAILEAEFSLSTASFATSIIESSEDTLLFPLYQQKHGAVRFSVVHTIIHS